jgi:hypothetical protein
MANLRVCDPVQDPDSDANYFAEALVFGGVDKNRYKGKFFSLPVQLPGRGGGDDLWRYLTKCCYSHSYNSGSLMIVPAFGCNSPE